MLLNVAIAVTGEDPRIVWSLEKLSGWKVNRPAEFPQILARAPLCHHIQIQLGVLPGDLGMIIVAYNFPARDFDDVLEMVETSSSNSGWLASSSFEILQKTRQLRCLHD
jgi:hypothetical protein